jgi:hypothetical protein
MVKLFKSITQTQEATSNLLVQRNCTSFGIYACCPEELVEGTAYKQGAKRDHNNELTYRKQQAATIYISKERDRNISLDKWTKL